MLSFSARTKAALLALGIFALGLVCGATLERWFMFGRPRPPGGPFSRDDRSFRGAPSPERMLRRFGRDLDLTPEQQEQIRQILEESREAMLKVRRDVHGRFEALSRNTRIKIRDILTPEQQKEYDELTERFRHRMEREWGRRRRPPPPGGPPGP